MCSSAGLTLLLAAMILGSLRVLALPVPESNALTAASATSHSALATLFEPCTPDSSEEETLCGPPDDKSSLCILTRKMQGDIKEYSQRHPESMSHCAEQGLPVLQWAKVTLSSHDAANKEAFHKAVASLHLVAYFLSNTSTINADTRRHYEEIRDNFQQLSCNMKCTSLDLDTKYLQSFVKQLVEGDGAAFFEQENVFKKTVNETEFSNYQCLFLRRANETLTDIISYSENNC